jgi:hypothetical protein
MSTTAGITDAMLGNIRATLAKQDAAVLRPIQNMSGYFVAENNVEDQSGNMSYLFPVMIDDKEVHIYLRI